jgi:hypothetical protein
VTRRLVTLKIKGDFLHTALCYRLDTLSRLEANLGGDEGGLGLVLGQLPDFGFAFCGVDDDAPAVLAEVKAAYFLRWWIWFGTLQPSSQMARL